MAQAWLAAQHRVEVVTRNCGGAYALVVTRVPPGTMQVATAGVSWKRWPGLPRRDAELHAPDPGGARRVIVDPDLFTAAEKPQYEGYLRREDVYAAVLKLSKVTAPVRVAP